MSPLPMVAGSSPQQSMLPSRDSSYAPPPRQRGYVKEALNTDKEIFVIKVGTSSLVRPEHQAMNLSAIARICEVVKALSSEGHHVIIVTSGAVGVGCQHLRIQPGPHVPRRALAAIGQVQLMKFYEDFLGALGMSCAQLLLTADNLAVRGQYLAARTTFIELLSYGVVPVINENDTVAVQELRFGDNDTLSAQVAALVQADWLYLLTDVDCLYTANPKDDPAAQPIYEVEDIVRLNADTSTRGTQWGTGGMATKLTAGRIATAAGCTMVICNSNAPENILRIAKGEARLGTKFYPLPFTLKGRKRWILSVPVRGRLVLDPIAVRAILDPRMPLVVTHVAEVQGVFNVQDCVSLVDQNGTELARGLVSLPAADLATLLEQQQLRERFDRVLSPRAPPRRVSGSGSMAPSSGSGEDGGGCNGMQWGKGLLQKRRSSSTNTNIGTGPMAVAAGPLPVGGDSGDEGPFELCEEIVIHRGNLVLMSAGDDASSGMASLSGRQSGELPYAPAIAPAVAPIVASTDVVAGVMEAMGMRSLSAECPSMVAGYLPRAAVIV